MAFVPTAAKERTSSPAQFKALLVKNAVFQCKNWKSCCFIIVFPIIILFALFALDKVIFAPLKLKAVCGNGALRGLRGGKNVAGLVARSLDRGTRIN